MKMKYQDHSVTSQEAALFIEPYRATARAKVFLAIIRAGQNGITDEEISELLKMSQNTARPRRIELFEAGLIEEFSTRATESGCSAVCWRSTGDKYDEDWFNARNRARDAKKRRENFVVMAAQKYADDPSNENLHALMSAAKGLAGE